LEKYEKNVETSELMITPNTIYYLSMACKRFFIFEKVASTQYLESNIAVVTKDSSVANMVGHDPFKTWFISETIRFEI
jgi:hypothetical protein